MDETSRIKTENLRAFFIRLRNDYHSRRITVSDLPPANKTIHCIYMCLAAFYTRAARPKKYTQRMVDFVALALLK